MRVCLLISDQDQNAWFANSVEKMLKETSAEITLIAKPERKQSANNTRTKKIVNLLPNRFRDNIPIFVKKIYAWLFFSKMRSLMVMTPRLEKQCQSKSITRLEGLSDPSIITFEPLQVDKRVQIPKNTISEISENCDLVIHKSVGILSGGILTATEHGVLSFHHGDIREYRGVPAGFWEFMHGKSTAGVTLQQLTEELDNGRIVEFQEVDISEANSWSDVLYKQCRVSEDMLADAIRNIQSKEFEPEKPREMGDLYLKSDVMGWNVKIQYLKRVLF